MDSPMKNYTRAITAILTPSPNHPTHSNTPMSPSKIDPKSGFCYETKTFHSLRPEVQLPPPSLPLSSAAFAFAFGFGFSSSSPLPSHPAFIDSVTSAVLFYPQLLSRVHSLSSNLQKHHSLPPNATAFVISPPTLHIPILYFSLLNLGIAVSPSNLSSSPSEISHHLQLSNPSLIFATSSSASKLTIATDVNVILLDSPHFLSLLDSPAGAPLSLPKVDQSDTAAVLFSSGTTGMVKGVAITHRNLIASMAPLSAAAGAAATVFMATVPLFHVFGFLRVLSTVAAGGDDGDNDREVRRREGDGSSGEIRSTEPVARAAGSSCSC